MTDALKLELEQFLAAAVQELPTSQTPRDDVLLLKTAVWWCEQLDWPTQIAEDTLALKVYLGQHLVRLVLCFKGMVRFKSLKGLISPQNEEPSKSLLKTLSSVLFNEDDYNKSLDEVMTQLDIKDYALLILGFVAVGFVLHKLRSTKAPSEQKERGPLTRRTAPNSQGWVLILVINQKHKEVISKLKSGIDLPRGDELAKATDSLWLGKREEYEGSELSQWFNKHEPASAPDEYSVYFAKFELDHEIPKLSRGETNKLARFDGFQDLLENHLTQDLSVLLPKEAWRNNNLYMK